MKNRWVEPDIRDNVVETVLSYKERTKIPIKDLISFAGISSGKFYDWEKRYGIPNKHNGEVPKSSWLLDWEKKAIVKYSRTHEEEGYRRLCYQMIDKDVAYASPSTVYRILRANNLLNVYIPKSGSGRGSGYRQPGAPHEEWHIDISYVNVLGSFMFLIAVIDGYSRFITHHELRTYMQEEDVTVVLQRAYEKFSGTKPRIISDRGSQFISREFKKYLRFIGLKHTYTSVSYPQSNGKIERFFRTTKEECIRRNSFLSIEDAREIINKYVDYYNYERLHSAIDYITPYDMMIGRREEILKSRDEKLRKARMLRIENYNKKTNLLENFVFSYSR